MYFSKLFDMTIFRVTDLIMFADMSDHCELPFGRLNSPKVLSIPSVRHRVRSFCFNVVVDKHFMLLI